MWHAALHPRGSRSTYHDEVALAPDGAAPTGDMFFWTSAKDLQPSGNEKGIDTQPPLAPATPPSHLSAGQLFREEAVYVARFLHRLGFADADVADLTQTVFLIAHQKGGFSVRGPSPRSWLYSIAFRVAATERRNRRRRPSGNFDLTELTDPRDPETSLQQRRSLRRVQRCLAKLDMPHQATFVLYEVEGLSGPEIAEALGVPVGTVYRRIHVARQRFAAAYAEERDSDE